MKNLLCILGIIIALTGCGVANEKGEPTESDIQNISQMENEIHSLEKINKDFQEVMTIGDNLISILSSIEGKSLKEEYEALVKADKYVDEMKAYYSDLIEECASNDDLNGMIFHLNILSHSCPNPIANDDATSINNQKILYSLHLKQISSSFTFLSKYMDYIAGNCSKPKEETYFSEVSIMPTPDAVLNEITYDSKKTESGVVQYMYLIGQTENDANLNYNAYIVALMGCDDVDVEITSNAVYVKMNNIMVSAMMAGNDPEKGRFMIVSFREE